VWWGERGFLACADLLCAAGLWMMFGPGVLLLLAAILWKMAMERAQCSIAGAESHGLMGGAVFLVVLGVAILIYTCFAWSSVRDEDGRALVEMDTPPGGQDSGPMQRFSRRRGARHLPLPQAEGPADFEEGAEGEGGGGGDGGGGGKGGGGTARSARIVTRIFSVPCLLLNLSIASTLVAGALFYAASFAHGAQQFQMLDSELKLKWGVGDADARTPGADIPLWVGEFGKPASTPSLWWKHLMRFFVENPSVGWAYWPLNGAKWRNETYEWEDETYGILEMDYVQPRNPSLVADLMATLGGTQLTLTNSSSSSSSSSSSALSPGGWGGRQEDVCCLQTPRDQGCADECIKD